MTRFYRWMQLVWLPAILTPKKENPVLAKIKKWFTSSPTGTKIKHYIVVGVATFALAAIASGTHVADMHQPLSWSAVAGVAVAGLKAVYDFAEPLVLALLEKLA